VQLLRMFVDQELAEAVDPAQRRAQIVRDRIVERFELAVRRFQRRRALLQRQLQPSFVLAQPQVDRMLVKRDLDDTAQVRRLEWLDQIGGGIRMRCTLQRVFVRMRCQEHDRYIVLVANGLGGSDAVDLAGEADVHQDQLRMQTSREIDGFFTARRRACDRVAELIERVSQVQSEDAVVLHDQDARTRPYRAIRRGGVQTRGMDRSQFFLSLSSTASRASSSASSTLFAVDSSPPFLIVSTASSTSSPARSTGPCFSQAARPIAAVAANAAQMTLGFMSPSRRITTPPAQTSARNRKFPYKGLRAI